VQFQLAGQALKAAERPPLCRGPKVLGALDASA
jgi:hypothetical protein